MTACYLAPSHLLKDLATSSNPVMWASQTSTLTFSNFCIWAQILVLFAPLESKWWALRYESKFIKILTLWFLSLILGSVSISQKYLAIHCDILEVSQNSVAIQCDISQKSSKDYVCIYTVTMLNITLGGDLYYHYRNQWSVWNNIIKELWQPRKEGVKDCNSTMKT